MDVSEFYFEGESPEDWEPSGLTDGDLAGFSSSRTIQDNRSSGKSSWFSFWNDEDDQDAAEPSGLTDIDLSEFDY